MDYLAFRRLFEEFSKQLEGQHVYYLDSIIGFTILHDRIVEHQSKSKSFLGDNELANDEFLDTCSTSYKQISTKDFKPVSLSPLMKQGHVKARNKENGYNGLLLASNCIVALYSYWEEYLRIEIGIAKGVLSSGATKNEETREILNKHVVYDIWGDIRHLRNSIVHNNGIAYSYIVNCKVLNYFRVGDKIDLDIEKMQNIFRLLGEFRNELNRMSRPPRKGITLPGKPQFC